MLADLLPQRSLELLEAQLQSRVVMLVRVHLLEAQWELHQVEVVLQQEHRLAKVRLRLRQGQDFRIRDQQLHQSHEFLVQIQEEVQVLKRVLNREVAKEPMAEPQAPEEVNRLV